MSKLCEECGRVPPMTNARICGACHNLTVMASWRWRPRPKTRKPRP